MKIIKPAIALLLFSYCTLTSQGQTTSTIEVIQKDYQECLDQGGYMLGCSKYFYGQMDSMLNVVYRQLRSAYSPTNKAQLKKEQLDWLAKRDKYFKESYKVFKKNNPDIEPYGAVLGAQDDAMIMYDENAKFVKERVLLLITLLQKAKSKQ